VEEPATVYFTGTAGAGKTSFVVAYRDWMKAAGYDVITLNLDPGNESTEFEPDIDIREWVRLPEVMSEYNLGPNGAQVAAADLIAIKIFDVREALGEFRSDYILVDTPGQVELFAFRESSKAIVEALSGDRSLIAFLFDPALSKSASGFAALLLLSATVEFRFRLPMLNVLSKSDVLTSAQVDEIVRWGEEPGALYDAVTSEMPTPDLALSAELVRALDTLSPLGGLVPTSSRARTGLEHFYRANQRVFAGGEDLEPSHAPTSE
jgi:GPN-loop GTPase